MSAADPRTQYRLELTTWSEVEAYLGRSRAVIVPIGSTEQHGPNGILGTDFICAEEISRRVGVATDTLVAPTISVGMARHHMGFPGTITLRPETLMAVLRDYAWSLYQHGFRGIVFVNGHGGNIATAGAALANIREDLADARLEWIDWYRCAQVGALSRELFGDREGAHATPSEVSVTMAAYPDVVRMIDGPLDVESCPLRGIGSSRAFRAAYPDGRMASDPSLARPAHGERLILAAVEAIAAEVARVRDDVAP
ncbi:creatininase family protein [Haliangium sp.]|uniref:creatininase family protein n=1 Tax=Haliangium sp. TaxID=2663208 RepID=UPI003D0E355F